MALPKRPLIDAVLAQLRADTALADKVHFGAVPDPEHTDAPLDPPYVVVHADTGTGERERLSSTTTTRTDITLTVQAVGGTATQALWWSDRAAARLMDHRPVVAGYTCEPLRHTDSAAIEQVTEFTPTIHYSSDDYVLTARSA